MELMYSNKSVIVNSWLPIMSHTLCCDASVTDCFHACLLDYQHSTISYQKYADLHEQITSFWYHFSSSTHIVSVMCQWSLSISHYLSYGWWRCFTKCVFFCWLPKRTWRYLVSCVSVLIKSWLWTSLAVIYFLLFSWYVGHSGRFRLLQKW